MSRIPTLRFPFPQPRQQAARYAGERRPMFGRSNVGSPQENPKSRNLSGGA
jgi:hypothetical protein